jgi:hypothetical protein
MIALPVQTVQVTVHDPAEIESDVAALAREPSTGLAVLPDQFMVGNRAQVIASTTKHAPYRPFMPMASGLRVVD